MGSAIALSFPLRLRLLDVGNGILMRRFPVNLLLNGSHSHISILLTLEHCFPCVSIVMFTNIACAHLQKASSSRVRP